MKKSLIILCAVMLAGCMSVSSTYDGAKPVHSVQNTDGSATFEFLFEGSEFDGIKASQRIDEYFAGYRNEKELGGYEIMDISYSETGAQSIPRKMHTRVFVRVLF